MSRVRLFALVLLAAACEGPQYAQFDPLPADVAVERAVRAHFSMPVPTGWSAAAEGEALTARETPPANGRIRAYRTLAVTRIEAVPGDDEAARRTAALGLLRRRYAEEGLVEVATGHGQLAGRDSAWLFGSVHRGSIDMRFDLLAHVIPCRDEALLVEFTTPAGQFENARAGFAALASGLETDLAPPRGNGTFVWFGGERVGLWVDDEWTVQKDVEGCAGVLTSKTSSLRCEVNVDAASAASDFDDYVDECCADLVRIDARIESVERGIRDGRAFARIRSVCAGGVGASVRDSVVVQRGQRVDSLAFVVPCSEWATVRASVERAAASATWKE